MENIGLSLSHSVQIQFIAVEISSFTNRPIHQTLFITVYHGAKRGATNSQISCTFYRRADVYCDKAK